MGERPCGSGMNEDSLLTPDEFVLALAPTDQKKRKRRSCASSSEDTYAIPVKTRKELIVGLILPSPPSANLYWRTMVIRLKRPSAKQLRRGEIGKYSALTMPSREAKEYIKLLKERIESKGLNFHSRAPIRLSVVVCMATNGRADIGNRIKILEDALQEAGVYEDDCQIVELHVERGPVIKGGRVIVNVTEVTPDPNGAIKRSCWNGT